MVCDGIVRQVRLQWSFSNFAMIPPGIDADPAETYLDRQKRRTAKESLELPSAALFTTTEKVDLEHLLDDLRQQGYFLKSVAWQSRIDTNGSRYPAVYAIFVHQHFRSPDPDAEARAALLRPLVDNVLWRVRGYSNVLPMSADRDLVQCSLNFELRTPLIDNRGCRIGHWKRDAFGNKIGERIEVQAVARLRLTDGLFALCPV